MVQGNSALVTFAAMLLAGLAVRADEPDDLELVKKPAAKATAPAGEEKIEESRPKPDVESAQPRRQLDSLDDALLERLDGESPAKATNEGQSLDDVVRGMRDAQQRLAERDAGRKTQDIQAEIVRQLEQLIEQAKQSKSNPNQPPMPSTSPQKPESQAQQQENDEQKPAEQQQAEAEQQPESQTQRSARENQQAKESTDETREARRLEAERARRAEMVNAVWGHLPPTIREKLLNISSEEYLPKYEEEVRRYFESLAEPRGGRR